MYPKKFNFYQDPGHAWLRVPLSELRRGNLISKISSYSYMNGKWAYLEEDQDAPLYLNRLEEDGYKPFITFGCINRIISNKPSKIRNYARFNYIKIISKGAI